MGKNLSRIVQSNHFISGIVAHSRQTDRYT